MTPREAETGLRKQEEVLAKFSDHEETVLWFEHDLFCQVQLIYLLNWFANHQAGKTKLSTVCINEFPGINDFRGLGQLDQEQLASLFPQRREISHRQLELGAQAWQAYSSAEPTIIEALLAGDSSALPFLRNAFAKHLERFPSARNGLGRVENAGLELIGAGHCEFKSLFPAFGKCEPAYGFGDAQLYFELTPLAGGSCPLIEMTSGGKSDSIDSNELSNSSFQITEHGQRVLRGDEDFLKLNGIDKWLGGSHLQGEESPWRWDEVGKRLIKLKHSSL